MKLVARAHRENDIHMTMGKVDMQTFSLHLQSKVGYSRNQFLAFYKGLQHSPKQMLPVGQIKQGVVLWKLNFRNMGEQHKLQSENPSHFILMQNDLNKLKLHPST